MNYEQFLTKNNRIAILFHDYKYYQNQINADSVRFICKRPKCNASITVKDDKIIKVNNREVDRVSKSDIDRCHNLKSHRHPTRPLPTKPKLDLSSIENMFFKSNRSIIVSKLGEFLIKTRYNNLQMLAVCFFLWFIFYLYYNKC